MNVTCQPLTLKKVKGFDDRRQGTIVRTLSDGTEHTVTVVTSKRGTRRHHAVYVSVEGEGSRYAGYVESYGVGTWRVVHRNYAQPLHEVGTGYTDHGTLTHMVETVAYGYLNSRDYHLKGE